MRRALLIILGVGLLAAAPAAADPNPQTIGLQVALRAHGLYKGEIDGIRGPATVRAVRIFQRRRHLAVDGVPGTRTRHALGRLGTPLFGKRAIAPDARSFRPDPSGHSRSARPQGRREVRGQVCWDAPARRKTRLRE